MKVTGIETIVIDNIPPYRGGRQWLFIKLLTDEGLIGLGERPRATRQTSAPKSKCSNPCARSSSSASRPST